MTTLADEYRILKALESFCVAHEIHRDFPMMATAELLNKKEDALLAEWNEHQDYIYAKLLTLGETLEAVPAAGGEGDGETCPF